MPVIRASEGAATAGHILQVLGVATDVGEINAEIGNPVVRA